MKISLSLVAALIGSLLACPFTSQAEETLIDLNFESTEPNNPPVTETFQETGTNHTLETTNVTSGNKLEVVKDVTNFPGKALRFTKTSAEPRSPAAVMVNKPGFMSSGRVRFTWDAAMESFTPGDKFPGFEALLTFVLMDRVGRPFFNMYFLVGKDQTTGVIGCADQKFGTWSIGEKLSFAVTLDLDKKTAVVEIDGAQAGQEISIPDADGLRVVQFTDGAGLAFYGGQFTATVGNFKMTKL